MLKASEYFSFKTNWITNIDLSSIVSCRQYQKECDWDSGDGENESIPNSFEDTTFQRSNGDPQNLQINCWCTAHLNVSIFGLEVVSNIRTIELYSHADGYLKTCRGTKLDRADDVDGKGEATLYYSCLKLDNAVDDIAIKFITPADVETVHVWMFDFKLLQGVSTGLAAHNSGMVDMSKVRGYLHSMGDNLPAQAAEMMESVENFQKTQMTNLNQLTSGSALSSVLSKVTSLSNQAYPAPSVPDSLESSSSSASPLQALLSQMTLGQTDSWSPENGQGGGGMFQMLQNICGKVGRLREKEINNQKEDLKDTEATSEQSCDKTTEAADALHNSSVLTSESIEHLKTELEQSVSQMIQSSEERLKKYIDTSLQAMENRLCTKMDTILKFIEKNGHTNS